MCDDIVSIDIRSMNRLYRMFDTASNICAKTKNNIHFTFVLLFAVTPSSNTSTNISKPNAKLFAVRNFFGPEAEMVNNILQCVYEDIEPLQEMLQLLHREWRQSFPDHELLPYFPHVYTFFFDPTTYRNRAFERQIETPKPIKIVESTDLVCLGMQICNNKIAKRTISPTPTTSDSDEEEETLNIVNSILREREKAEEEEEQDYEVKTENLTDQKEQTYNEQLDRLFNNEDDDTVMDTVNFVNNECFAAFLRTQNTTNNNVVEKWLIAHECVDSILFEKARLTRMYEQQPPHVKLRNWSLVWRLPLFLHLANRYVNSVLIRLLPYSQDTPRLDFLFSNADYGYLNDTAGKLSRTMSYLQCYAKKSKNVVLPSDWLIVKLLSSVNGLTYLVVPDSEFNEMRLLARDANDISSIGEQLDSIFWTHTDKTSDRTTTDDKEADKNSNTRRTRQHHHRCRNNKPMELHVFRSAEKLYGSDTLPDLKATTHVQFISFVSMRRRPVHKNCNCIFQIPIKTDNNTVASSAVDTYTFDHWEQGITAEMGLRFVDRGHVVNVNSNPGTGKSVIMSKLIKQYRRPMCAVPTNKMKQELAERLLKSLQNICCCITTVSACLRRVGLFLSHTPDIYSNYIVKRYKDSISYLYKSLCQMENNIDTPLTFQLIWMEVQDDKSNKKRKRKVKPVKVVHEHSYVCKENLPENTNYARPDILLLDEVNMCLWQHIAFLQRGVRRLGIPLMLFGDSSQNLPIGALADNGDLIAISCSALNIQMLKNKRLIADSSNDEEMPGLARVLADNVWRMVSSRETEKVLGEYTRTLLKTNLGHLFDVTEINLSESVCEWYAAIERLDEYYLMNPCARYATANNINRIPIDKVPRPVQHFLIALRNNTCDRFAHWFASTFYEHLLLKFPKENAARRRFYAFKYKRSAFVPYRQLLRIPESQITFTEPTNFDREIEELQAKKVCGTIEDDPWMSTTIFCVGMIYCYLGKRFNTGTLLRLIQVVPSNKYAFMCDDLLCVNCRPRRGENFSGNQMKPIESGIAGLLMQPLDKPGDLFYITPEYYVTSRYRSHWGRRDDNSFPRQGSAFYGFPLRLHASLTCYKVQGETLRIEDFPAVHVDLCDMSRAAALVSLSRVTSEQQIKSILNTEHCCRYSNTENKL